MSHGKSQSNHQPRNLKRKQGLNDGQPAVQRGPHRSAPGRKQVKLPQIRISREEADHCIRDCLEVIGSPVALSAWLLYKYGEHKQLVERTVSAGNYLTVDSFRKDYCATKLLAKCAGLSTGVDTAEVAIRTALEAEQMCRETNQKFRPLLDGRGVSPGLTTLIPRVASILQKLLGELRPGMFRDCGFGPGRTSSASGDYVSSLFKYSARLDVTVSALNTAVAVIGSAPHWGQAALTADGPCTPLPAAYNLVRGNTLITVPKNAKTDRAICYEPHCNIRLQKMVGEYLKKRASLFGIKLSDQSVNQRRARFGSKFGTLSTIDLRSASDTMATLPLMLVLPDDWFRLLDSLRSKETLWPDGTWRRNEKFVSMGNGFAFELESLLFYAICSAVTHDVSVFGDDIIVPTDSFDKCCEALSEFGFAVNSEKSFSEGSFRESCGYDGMLGYDVTPCFIRAIPKMRGDLVKLHNAMRRWLANDVCPDLKGSRVLARWRKVFPVSLGPEGYGDGHYHVSLDESKAHWDTDTGGWWFVTYQEYYPGYVTGTLSEEREFVPGLGAQVLCVSLGPKAPLEAYASAAYRRFKRVRRIRVLASANWPEVLWFKP